MAKEKMKKSDKKLLIIAIVVAVVSIIVIIITNRNLLINLGIIDIPYTPPEEKGENFVVYNGIKSNNSIEFRQPKYYDEYKISSATLTYENEMSTFVALVTIDAEVKDKLPSRSVKIGFLNKDGTTIGYIRGYIPSIKPGQTLPIQAMVAADIVDSYDYEIMDDDEKKE